MRGWTQHSKRSLPDLICTKLTVESSCCASPAIVFPTCLSRSGPPLAVNTQTSLVKGVSKHLPGRQQSHLAQDSSWTVSSQAWAKQPERNGTRYCWAPSPTCCTSSDVYVNLSRATVYKPGRNSPQKPRIVFLWLKGLGKGSVGSRANAGMEGAQSPSPSPPWDLHTTVSSIISILPSRTA